MGREVRQQFVHDEIETRGWSAGAGRTVKVGQGDAVCLRAKVAAKALADALWPLKEAVAGGLAGAGGHQCYEDADKEGGGAQHGCGGGAQRRGQGLWGGVYGYSGQQRGPPCSASLGRTCACSWRLFCGATRPRFAK